MSEIVFCQTYTEKLGFPKGSKDIILHVDDAGMSYDSNMGTIKATEQGVVTSLLHTQQELNYLKIFLLLLVNIIF